MRAGADFALAVTADGVVWLWGGNASGQLLASRAQRMCRIPGRECGARLSEQVGQYFPIGKCTGHQLVKRS
ncbi:MAG: hypothetical protein KJ066_09110 [Acidobacteria bacterium]|nr:hypothetical protein [Acidobacteriota bacterium]